MKMMMMERKMNRLIKNNINLQIMIHRVNQNEIQNYKIYIKNKNNFYEIYI